MSFISTTPAELSSAATQLSAIGSALSSENAAAAAATTTIAPPASDAVSQLQSKLFSAYGQTYQQIAAEAQRVQLEFAQTLGISSNTYNSAEAANTTANTLQDQATNFFNHLGTFFNTSGNGNPFNLSGQNANFLSYETGNWASAMSDCLGMAGGGLIPSDWLGVTADATDATAAAGMVSPATMVASTTPLGALGMPSAAVGQATLVSSLSAPPAWASSAASTSAATAVSATPLSAAAPGARMGTFIPGMPGMGALGRNGAGFGAPRYGIKPLVMKKLGLVAV